MYPHPHVLQDTRLGSLMWSRALLLIVTVLTPTFASTVIADDFSGLIDSDERLVDELLASWKGWGAGFDALPPLHRTATQQIREELTDADLSVIEHDDYMDNASGYAAYHRRIADWNSTLPKDGHDQTVSLNRPASLITLGRNTESQPWSISYSGAANPLGTLCPSNFETVTDLIDARRKRGSKWGQPTLTRDSDSIQLSLRFQPPLIREPRTADVKVLSLDVWFTKEPPHVPLRVTQEIQSGDSFFNDMRLSNFMPFGDMQFPRTIEGFYSPDPNVVPFELGYRLETHSLEKVDANEVARRSKPAFWQMQDVQRRRWGYRWAIAGVLLITGIGLWWVQSRRQSGTPPVRSV